MKNKRIISAFMAAGMSIGTVLCAYAAGPGQTSTIPDGYTAEQWERLTDQHLDFDELYDRVNLFNPSIQRMTDPANTGLADQQTIMDLMKRQVQDVRDDAKELKDSGAANTAEGAMQYQILQATVKELNKQISDMKTSMDLMARPTSSAYRQSRQYSKNMTTYAQSAVIGYNSAAANLAMVKKAQELAEAGYKAQQSSQSLGMATEADVLSAQKQVLSAQASVKTMEDTMDSTRRSICLLTGYPEDTALEIGAVPQLDLALIGSLNLEADTVKAIGNNYTLISERHSSSAKSSSAINSRLGTIEADEQKLTIKMQNLYQTLMDKKGEYEAAMTAFQKATMEKEKADRSYQLGMLSKLTYLQAEMGYLQADGSRQSAYHALYQAYCDYDWAVNGVVELD